MTVCGRGLVVATAVVALLLASCAATPPAGGSPDLANTSWVLASLAGRAPVAETTLTMRFEDARVQGANGCNRYTAPYTTRGSTLEIDTRVASTAMACPPPTMAQADAFMRALGNARSWRIAGGELQLAAADGMVLAVFAARPQTLGGTSWRVTAYNNGKQAVASVLPGTTPTMVFGTDGRLSGSGGCNRYTAAYSGDERKLQVVMVGSTRTSCAQPERVMEQEQQFLAALPTVASARLEGERLELRSADGALAVTATRERAP